VEEFPFVERNVMAATIKEPTASFAAYSAESIVVPTDVNLSASMRNLTITVSNMMTATSSTTTPTPAVHDYHRVQIIGDNGGLQMENACTLLFDSLLLRNKYKTGDVFQEIRDSTVCGKFGISFCICNYTLQFKDVKRLKPVDCAIQISFIPDFFYTRY
jgi:hypothetical protein